MDASDWNHGGNLSREVTNTRHKSDIKSRERLEIEYDLQIAPGFSWLPLSYLDN